MKKIILTLALISGIGAPSIFTFVPCATAQVLGGEGPRARQSGLRGDVLDVNLRNPGTLEDCITPSEMDRVRCIRLSGSINGDDIGFIRTDVLNDAFNALIQSDYSLCCIFYSIYY